MLLLLVAARVPSLAQPAGGDQSLYTYQAQRMLDGGVPYRDAWDQKPPAVFFIYAALWRIWPHESVVAAADLAAAALTAWLLVILGRRWFGQPVGLIAAGLFLLLADPSIQRHGGLTVRAQCETFIALAVTAALVALTSRPRRSWRLMMAGVWLGVACWLKYNAAVFALPVGLATVLWTAEPAPGSTPDSRRRWADLATVGAGVVMVSLAMLAYFAAHGALDDLRRATIDYNLQYSGETYGGISGPIGYLFAMPFERARVDLLWFLGLLGALVLATRLREHGAGWMVLAWIAASAVSIAINGARGLPQYFVQATPAFALAAAAGIALAWRAQGAWRLAMAAVALVGLWRVGTEATPLWRPRLGGVPQIAANLSLDLQALTGRVDRRQYLTRFGGTGDTGKFSAVAVDDLAARVRQSTTEADAILVFGFSGGGVLAKSSRVSASRFFWSRPVVVEFARGVPGYGSAGLLEDLRQRPPALVALQKRDRRIGEPGVPNSLEFFMSTGPLRQWLEAAYTLEDDGAVFAVWRRRS